MTPDEWLADYVREFGVERANRELSRLAEALRLRATGDGFVPWTAEDDAKLQFAPGELELLLTPFDADELIGIEPE